MAWPGNGHLPDAAALSRPVIGARRAGCAATIIVLLLAAGCWLTVFNRAPTGMAAIAAAAIAWLSRVAAAASGFGIVVVLAGALAVRRFAARQRHHPVRCAPISVLRPLCGAEPHLDRALETLCGQRYPVFQIVFGVQDATDPALRAVERVRRRHPDLDIVVVVDASTHGRNRKVSNLINMLPRARHDTLVFSDSDLHVAPDYLERLAAALAAPRVGLVTTLCTGRPTVRGLAARLGAMQITHCFLPGALLSRLLGRQDCLGTTMALRRQTLAQVGGLYALVDRLADDNVLGQLVRRLGLRVGLADTVPATGVPEASLASLWHHELRWARTIGALEPAGFAASALQFPLAWAGLCCLCSGLAAWSVELFGAAWSVRVLAAWIVGATLRRGPGLAAPGWAERWLLAALLPVRDLLSVGQIAVSYLGGTVRWRGHVMPVDTGRIEEHAAGAYVVRRSPEFAGAEMLEAEV